MTGRILLLGATGYTDGLVLEALLRRSLRPILAGRNPATLSALAERSGGLDQAVVDVGDPESLRARLNPGDVLITTVGPFERYGYPVAEAAADIGAHYIDSTGEVGFVRNLRERYDRRARETGAVMLPAFGYDYVPGVLAGALAVRQAGESVRALDIGYFATAPLRTGISQGTRTTMRDGLTLPSTRLHRHRLIEERTASRVRDFPVLGGRRSAFLVSGTEVLFLPTAFPELSGITVYNGWFPEFSRVLSVVSGVVAAVNRLPGGAKLTDLLTRPMAGGPPGGPDVAERAGNRSLVVGLATNGALGSEPLAEVQLEGPNPYSLTGELMAWAAQHLAEGSARTRPESARGVVGPIEAFGLEVLREAGAEIGLVPR